MTKFVKLFKKLKVRGMPVYDFGSWMRKLEAMEALS